MWPTTLQLNPLEKVAINDALPITAAQCDAISKLKSFWGFAPEL